MVLRTLAVFFIVVLIIFGLAWIFSDIFLYVSVSLVLSTLLRPLTNRISKAHLFSFRIPRFLAVIVSFITLTTILSLFVTLFIPLFQEQVRLLSDEKLWDEFQSNIAVQITDLEDLLIDNNLAGDQKKGFILNLIDDAPEKVVDYLDFQKIFSSLISLTGNFFVTTMAVTFITFFLLYENGILRRQIINLVPNHYFEVFIAGIFKVESLLSNYLIGLMLQMFAIFTLASIGLFIMGIKYAVTIALFAAVANLIPYLGPLLGSAFGIFVGISTSGDLSFSSDALVLILKVVSVFSIVQVTDNVVFQPLIFSKSVKAHPLEIFVIIFAGATVAGISGMIAAIPVYTIFRVSAVEMKKGFKEYHIFKVKKTDGTQVRNRRLA